MEFYELVNGQYNEKLAPFLDTLLIPVYILEKPVALMEAVDDTAVLLRIAKAIERQLTGRVIKMPEVWVPESSVNTHLSQLTDTYLTLRISAVTTEKCHPFYIIYLLSEKWFKFSGNLQEQVKEEQVKNERRIYFFAFNPDEKLDKQQTKLVQKLIRIWS